MLTERRRHYIVDAGRIQCGKRLCNGRVSVRSSVCPVNRQRQRHAAGARTQAVAAADIAR